MDLNQQTVETIADKIRDLVIKELQGYIAHDATASMTAAKLARMIDHTLLKPDAARSDIDRLCEEAREYDFFSVCVNPSYVSEAHKLLKDTPVKVACVVGFPLGAQATEIKALEAKEAIREGADEIDMVMNVGAMKSGDYDIVEKDIQAVAAACHESDVLLKVILETSLLTYDEKIKACELSMTAGANYVKTSTGFGSAGATEEDIRLMSKTVAPKSLGVKASGGVRSFDDAMRMIRAGATRIGSSNGIRIVEEASKRLSN